jgi:hypothetical protein
VDDACIEANWCFATNLQHTCKPTLQPTCQKLEINLPPTWTGFVCFPRDSTIQLQSAVHCSTAPRHGLLEIIRPALNSISRYASRS